MTEIRRIRPDEWRLFKKLRLTALKTDGDWFGRHYQEVARLDDATWQCDTIAAAVSDEFYIYLVFEDKETAGLCGCIRRESFGKLFALWVEPDYRSRGIGRLLAVETMKAADEPLYKLTVVEGNAPAVGLYESMGFVRFGAGYLNDKGYRELEMVLERS